MCAFWRIENFEESSIQIHHDTGGNYETNVDKTLHQPSDQQINQSKSKLATGKRNYLMGDTKNAMDVLSGKATKFSQQNPSPHKT
ncbi:unnamed protein product [Trichobilharzia regenti]|nr:unnamed protein product [Trichobilharzia regenti]